MSRYCLILSMLLLNFSSKGQGTNDLDVDGEILTGRPYLITTNDTFKLGGNNDTWYPVVFGDEGWSKGALQLEITRSNIHLDGLWNGSLIAKIVCHSSSWGHESDFWSADVIQSRDFFIGGVANVYHSPRVVVWLKGDRTYTWRSNQPARLVDATAVDTKQADDQGMETVNSLTEILPEYQLNRYSRSSGTTNTFQPGMIMLWSGNTPPTGWAICDGQNGTPDLRGRFVLGAGQAQGLTNRVMGETGGLETVALSIAEMPAHTHSVNDPGHFHNWTASRQEAGTDDNSNTAEFSRGDRGNLDSVSKNTDTKTTGITLLQAGGGLGHENMPPYYVLAYIIKL